ncbi:replication initiator [Streptosporangium sp. NPDC002721]|uniref:replication initiator n=1 Tax=Streptosporangium sp. NPDC002721 TaxID=3366188 RepID=UPI0036B96F4E
MQKVFTQWPRCHRNNVPSSHHENLARSHFSTKSRAYSTTMTALRRVRLEYRQARDLERLPYDPAATLVLANWRYAGQGYTTGESALASSISPQGGTVGH